MKRRRFLHYASLASTTCAVSACRQGNLFRNDASPSTGVDFGTPEKPNLSLGFVPMVDAAPLIVAQEKGFFSRYGLTVSLRRFPAWKEIESGLLEWRLDAAQAPFALPLRAQLGKQQASLISLMNLNLNGGAIALTQKAWQAGMRPSLSYTNFWDFAANFRNYVSKLPQTARFATDFPISMEAYLLRYWLSAMGLAPQQDAKLVEFSPTQLSYKLQAGIIGGYSVAAPWNQSSIEQKTAFITYVTRDIWKGHPSKVLATMDGWARKNPATARSLMAALLEACQYCDRPENQPEIAQILAQSQYLNVKADAIAPGLGGAYVYSAVDPASYVRKLPDFTIFHYRETDYLTPPNQANYPWRSHAVWLLTQMIRWNQLELREYPKDADKLLEKIYPVKLYEEVAKALNIPLPSDKLKKEPATAFIDRREFDPSQPVAYLNQFTIRASQPQHFFLG